MPAVCVAEMMTMMWLYGVQRLANRVSDMTGKSESFLWKWMWKFLCPTILAVSRYNWNWIACIEWYYRDQNTERIEKNCVFFF